MVLVCGRLVSPHNKRHPGLLALGITKKETSGCRVGLYQWWSTCWGVLMISSTRASSIISNSTTSELVLLLVQGQVQEWGGTVHGGPLVG